MRKKPQIHFFLGYAADPSCKARSRHFTAAEDNLSIFLSTERLQHLVLAKIFTHIRTLTCTSFEKFIVGL